jgi:hypothetical protein
MAQTCQKPPPREGGPRKVSFTRIDSSEDNHPQPSSQVQKLRLQFLAGRLQALGPKPLFHFVDELERGAHMRRLLETYAALPAELIQAYGGDQFGPAVHLVRRWRS